MITIESLRKQNSNMTHQDLANEINVDVKEVISWEKDIYTIPATGLHKIASHFKISADALLGTEYK